jgi:hypothetical protein
MNWLDPHDTEEDRIRVLAWIAHKYYPNVLERVARDADPSKGDAEKIKVIARFFAVLGLCDSDPAKGRKQVLTDEFMDSVKEFCLAQEQEVEGDGEEFVRIAREIAKSKRFSVVDQQVWDAIQHAGIPVDESKSLQERIQDA